MNLDYAKLAILEFLDIPTDRCTNAEIEFTHDSAIKATVTYEIFNPDTGSLEYETKTFETVEITQAGE